MHIASWPSARNAASAGMTPKLTTTPATDLTCRAAAGVEANTIPSRLPSRESISCTQPMPFLDP
jgi:hypothetical protein